MPATPLHAPPPALPCCRTAISMGDPGGIGPEVLVGALASAPVRLSNCVPLLFGNAAIMNTAAQERRLPPRFVGVPAAELPERLASARPPRSESETILVGEPPASGAAIQRGVIAPGNGALARRYIELAVAAAQTGDAHAVCTAPIAKEAMYAAGFEFPGHTEFLAHLCGRRADQVRMMLSARGLFVVLQTIHVALKEVPRLLTVEDIFETIVITARFASHSRGLPKPRIAVCGLNPHAGEGGHFGTEDRDLITPAIARALQLGINATGPHPADTLFHRVVHEAAADMVIAMYHDQGLVPVKLWDFHHGVNTTLGLPFVRTSPDHGTAFELVGKGQARCESMQEALLAASDGRESRP